MSREEHRKKWGRDINVDHIDGVGRGKEKPNNDINNLQTLCQICNARKGYYETRNA
jgi:hypothetical protein